MAGRSASYGAWARRRTEPGEVSLAPSLDNETVTRHFRSNVTRMIGVAMTGAVHFVDESEDDQGEELTLTVRYPVNRHGAELRLKTIEARNDRLYHLSIEQKGFSAFCCDVMVHDIAEDNFETQVELVGNMIAAQTFIGNLIRST